MSQVKWDLLPQLFRAQLLLTRALRNLQTPPAGVSSLYRPKLACQCRVWGLHPRPAPPTQGRATFCGHRLTWGIVKSASRAAPRLAPELRTPSLFTRWPPGRAAPRRRGHQKGDSGVGAAAARATQQPSPPPGFQQRRWEPCRGAHRAEAPGAVDQEGAGVGGSRRNPACASPGARCEPRSR